MNMQNINMTVAGLHQHYRNQELTPASLVKLLLAKCDEYTHKNIWIHRLSEEELTPYIKKLEGKSPETHPLYGIPFAIKDNLDLANIPTTAACEAYRHTPNKNAFVVEQLIKAGAIPLGKTNLDQFATGLVGTRSPFGACQNAFDDRYISGGSSSGSAVATSLGLVSFALGTDTAGSGRVPAAFNNLVGLKATKGLLSNTGMARACRSLDVVSIFSLNAEDANTVFNVAAKFDENDEYARKNIFANSQRVSGAANKSPHIGIPKKDQLEFYGDKESEKDFFVCIEKWQRLGATISEIDFEPFLEAARLLYEGPWVTERTIATKPILESNPDALNPSVRTIVEGGLSKTAEEGFNAQYRLQACKRITDNIFNEVDFLITPTAATTYTIEEVQQDPIVRNSHMGYYTNYMNLLDYAAIALPYENWSTEIPNGFTIVGQKFTDQKLLGLAKLWQNHTAKNLGNTKTTYTKQEAAPVTDLHTINVVVCGAHLEGQPLNWQLTERGGVLLEKTTSAPRYKLYALADGKRPGMERIEENGHAIEVEVWKVPADEFGSFVSCIPAPLGIGKVELEDGRWESGFICEHYGLAGATEISHYGSWRAYIARS